MSRRPRPYNPQPSQHQYTHQQYQANQQPQLYHAPAGYNQAPAGHIQAIAQRQPSSAQQPPRPADFNEVMLLRAKVDSLTEYSSTLESKVDILTRENIGLQSEAHGEISKQTERATQMQADNRNLHQYVSKVQSDLLEKLATQTRLYQNERLETEKRYSALHSERDMVLARQTNEMRLSKEREAHVKDASTKFVNQIDTLNSTVCALKNDLVDAFAHLDSMHATNSRLSRENEAIRLQSDSRDVLAMLASTKDVGLVQMQTKIDELVKQHDQQARSWQTKTDILVQRCTLLQSDLCDNNSLRISQASESNEELYKIKERSRSQESRLIELQKQNDDALTHSAQLAERLRGIEGEKKSLKKALSTLNLNQQVQPKPAIASLEADIDALKLQVIESQALTAQLNCDLLEIQKANAALQTSLDEYDAHVTNIEMQYAMLQAESLGLKQALDAKSRM